MNALFSSGDPVSYQTFIGGTWVDAVSGATFESEDPFSGDIWANVLRCNVADVDRAVEAAHRAFANGPLCLS